MNHSSQLPAEAAVTYRRNLVAQAIANVRARGLAPNPAALQLYERYVSGELALADVHALLAERAASGQSDSGHRRR